MPYLTGGFAWGHTHLNLNGGPGNIISAVGGYQTGWTAGAGAEFAVSGHWRAKAEYDYIDLSRRMYDLSAFAMPSVNVEPRIHLFKLGLNYQFGDTALDRAGRKRENRIAGIGDWNVHAQTTFSRQGYPAYRSPYAGQTACRDADSFRIPGPPPLPRRAAVAGRRILFRPGACAGRLASTAPSGSRVSPTARRRRPARHSRKIRPQRYLPEADLRPRRRAGRGRRRAQSVVRQTRHRPHHR